MLQCLGCKHPMEKVYFQTNQTVLIEIYFRCHETFLLISHFEKPVIIITVKQIFTFVPKLLIKSL